MKALQDLDISQMTSEELRHNALPMKPFGIWVHFDGSFSSSDELKLRHLIYHGCRLLVFSGLTTNGHDFIDDIVLSETDELVLTIGGNLDEATAFQFLSTRCPKTECTAKILLAFSKSKRRVPRILRQMSLLIVDAAA